MVKIRFLLSIFVMGLLLFCCMPWAHAAMSVNCTNPISNASSSGGIVTLNITCTFNNIPVGVNTLTPPTSNIVAPSSITLTSGANTLNAALQSTLTSPDGSVTVLLGSPAAGFTALITSPTSTIQFQYQVTTTAATPPGNYVSTAGAMSFNWESLGVPALISSGIAQSTLEVNVPFPPTSINCTSPSVNAPTGGGTFTMNVNCTISNSGSSLSPGASNTFSPASLTLTNGGNILNATLQSTVSSPDGSVTGITGSAFGGFTGTIQTLPANIQAQYSGAALNTTPSGTYTSGTISYIWSVI